MIYRPDITRGLECYVDADFAGGWKYGNHDSQESVFSRTGFSECMMDAQLLVEAICKHKFPCVLLKASTFLYQVQCEK